MNMKNNRILGQYRDNKENFEQLGDIAQEILEQLVKKAGIRVMTVEHRVKKERVWRESCTGKETGMRVWRISRIFSAQEWSAILPTM
ncbi:MAG: hypothetical protein ACI4SZ_03895 [Lachnospiraceae bacterium]